MVGPVRRGEIDAPKMRAGCEKLDADARAPLRCVADVDHAAFLLFFRHRIRQNKIFAEAERFVQIEQAAVCVDDDGLAVFAELAPLDILPAGAHGYSRKHP